MELDPISAMYAATEQVFAGKVAEIEMDFVHINEDESETRVSITVRKDIKYYRPPKQEDQEEDHDNP